MHRLVPAIGGTEFPSNLHPSSNVAGGEVKALILITVFVTQVKSTVWQEVDTRFLCASLKIFEVGWLVGQSVC